MAIIVTSPEVAPAIIHRFRRVRSDRVRIRGINPSTGPPVAAVICSVEVIVIPKNSVNRAASKPSAKPARLPAALISRRFGLEGFSGTSAGSSMVNWDRT